MSEFAIETLGLTKHYGDFVAVKNLDLAVKRGEVFGFLGPNGAGKTTTIRTLTDEIRPNSGTASIVGLDCQTSSVEIRSHLGYLPGDLAMYPRMTGKEIITFFANLRGGVDWGFVGKMAERLDADLAKRLGEMSTGNRQKVGLIQAFMNRPDVIIMDEPSTGLDPLVQAEFQAMMMETASEGRTVFLSSHTLSEVQRVADRVGIIRHGELVAVETVAALQSMATHRVEMRFAEAVQPALVAAVPGVLDLTQPDLQSLIVSFDGEVARLLDAVRSGPELTHITTREPDLEEIFLTYYRDDSPVGAADKASV